MQLKEAIESRRSVKSFSNKIPDWRKIIQAIDSARFAPAAGNYFVTKFILVSDKKIISELTKASQQDFVGTSKYIVVVVSDESKLVQAYEKRGSRYCAQQSGAAIENFLLSLTELKLATTWVGHFYDEQVRRALDIPENLNIEALFPIGIETKVKSFAKSMDFKFRTGGARKMKLEQTLYYDKYGNEEMIPISKVGRNVV